MRKPNAELERGDLCQLSPQAEEKGMSEDKGLEAEEVALKLFPIVRNPEIGRDLREKVAKALREFGDRAVKDKMAELFEGEDCRVSQLENDMYLNGSKQMRERCAKVCDKPVNEPLVSRIPGYVLAERIRALPLIPGKEE